MRPQTAEFVSLEPSIIARIIEALSHHSSAEEGLEGVWGGATKRGDRVYVPVRSAKQPKTMFDFYEAVAGAEVELRDEGLDVKLTPEYRQPYIVVAQVSGDPQIYIYESVDGSEYDDLEKLIGKRPSMIEGYPFDGPADGEAARHEALSQYPTAKFLHLANQ